MFLPAQNALLAAVQKRGEDFFEALGIEQPVLQMTGDDVVQLIHRDRPAFAAGRSLPGFDGAGVVAIAPALPGPQRHRAAAVCTKANAGKEGRTGGDSGRGDLGISGVQMRLHRVKDRLLDDRRHHDRHDLADRLKFFGLGPLVELMPADIGGAGEDAVHLAYAPSPAVAGEDAASVEVGNDPLHSQGTACSIPF
ncbi:MAG: hypothetical protein WCA78_12830 [Rhizomicrobium sp.]